VGKATMAGAGATHARHRGEQPRGRGGARGRGSARARIADVGQGWCAGGEEQPHGRAPARRKVAGKKLGFCLHGYCSL
jgi:hypothetical protein